MSDPDNALFNRVYLAPVILDRRTLERLEAGGVRALDQFLLREIDILKGEYKRRGNPHIIALAARAVLTAVAPLPQATMSFQAARLHALIGNMLIAQGASAGDLRNALVHLEVALSMLEHIQTFSEELRSAYVSFTLLVGVARKALGEFDESLRIMRGSMVEMLRSGEANQVDLVPLVRQEIIMLQTPSGHRRLASTAIMYRESHPLEYYGSIKRVFEYVMNTGRVHEAKRLYPEWRAAFLRVAHRVEPISQISFLKNLGQYAIELRAFRRADHLLRRALCEAEQRSLRGQVRQIEYLIETAGDRVGTAKLLTYQIDPLTPR